MLLRELFEQTIAPVPPVPPGQPGVLPPTQPTRGTPNSEPDSKEISSISNNLKNFKQAAMASGGDIADPNKLAKGLAQDLTKNPGLAKELVKDLPPTLKNIFSNNVSSMGITNAARVGNQAAANKQATQDKEDKIKSPNNVQQKVSTLGSV